MKDGLEDLVAAKAKEFTDMVLGEMKKTTKKEKPAFMEPVPPKVRLYNFDSMTEEDIQNFIFEFGQEAYMQEMFEADKIRRRYNARR